MLSRMRPWIGGALLGLIALVALDAWGQYTVVGAGIQRILINHSRQPSGVAEIQCLHDGGACYRDAGVVTIDLNQVSGGGSGNIQTPDGGVASRTIMVAANDGGTILASTAWSVTIAGNVEGPSGATVDTVDISQLAATVSGMPANPLASSFVNPGDANHVQGVYRCSGFTNLSDAGVVFPGCGFSVSPNKNTIVRVRYYLTAVASIDAGSTNQNIGFMCRIYAIRTGTDGGVQATPSQAACQADINSGSFADAGPGLPACDSGPCDLPVQGPGNGAATRWTIEIDDLSYGENP